jgi:predicted transcriptional regulator
MARKSAYDRIIKPNFSKIEQLLQKGFTEKNIAKSIGIAYSTWNKYKAENEEFSELIIKSRQKPVQELIDSMFKSGIGFTHTIKRMQKCKKVLYDPMTGKKMKETEEMIPYEEEIYIPPNFQAARFLILNWGRELGYSTDPAMLDLKEREFKHKQEMDNNSW